MTKTEAREKATNNVVNSLNKDGHRWELESKGAIVFYPSKNLAHNMIKDGMFSDWVEDETAYLQELSK